MSVYPRGYVNMLKAPRRVFVAPRGLFWLHLRSYVPQIRVKRVTGTAVRAPVALPFAAAAGATPVQVFEHGFLGAGEVVPGMCGHGLSNQLGHGLP